MKDFFKSNWQEPKQTKYPAGTSSITKTVVANRGCSRTEGVGATKQFTLLKSTAAQKLDCAYQARTKNYTKQVVCSHSRPKQPPQIAKVKNPPPERGKLDCKNNPHIRPECTIGSHKLAVERMCWNMCIHLIGIAD